MMKGKLISTMIRSGIWYSMENLAVDKPRLTMMKGKLISTMIRSGIWYSMENLAVDNLTI